MTADFSKAPRPAEHSPFPWTIEMGEGDRPYVCDANGTVILKFYRDSIARPIPWKANIATTLAAVNAYGAGQADAVAPFRVAPASMVTDRILDARDMTVPQVPCKHSADIARVLNSAAHPPAASARIAELEAALEKLEKAATEVNRCGATTGSQWPPLGAAIAKARAALAGGRT